MTRRGTGRTDRELWLERRAEGWRAASARWTTGLTHFLAASGLSVTLLPFSVFNQHSVLVHTAVGLAYTPLLAWSLERHVVRYWSHPLTTVEFTGWVAAGMIGAGRSCGSARSTCTAASSRGRGASSRTRWR